MSLYDVPLPAIDAARLESLRDSEVAESRTLDYKERLPEGEDDKKDLLQDVTAFANSAGGDLIYGVRERRENGKATGEPEAIVGLTLATETLDQAILRIENMLQDGIEPRVPGTRAVPIRRGGNPPCLLIRVPRSPLGPHMVIYRGARRFYGRGDAGNFLLDWGQIREGFVEAHGAQERLARFRRERVIRKNHKGRVLPLSAAMGGRLAAMKETSTSDYVFPGARGGFYHHFKDHFYAAVRAAGLTGVSPHVLRHCWASRMIEAGADLVTVRDLGGWSDLSLLSRYSHHRPQRAVEATEAMLARREAGTPPARLGLVGGPPRSG